MAAGVLALAAAAGDSGAQDAASQAPQGDGRTVFVRALATAEAGGLQRALAQKDWIYVADTLRTSEKSSARFVMRDHTLLAMKPASTVVLAEYQFKLEDTTASKMVTKVTSGGLRALTGLIDKRDPDKVVLHTPLATAGVRGTAIRVDLYPGMEEIIFDFGRGWVANRAGRVEVGTGWGARVISATILPELFKVGEDPEEPAFIVLDLLGRQPPDIGFSAPLPSGAGERRKALDAIVRESEQAGRTMDPANAPVLIGLLEQVPNPDPERSLAVIEGLLLATEENDVPLIHTAVQLVPNRAPELLEIATRAGLDLVPALQAVLDGLLPVWPEPVPAVMARVEQLGMPPDQAGQILESVRQSVPCRRTPGLQTPEQEPAPLACAPATPPPSPGVGPIVLRYSANGSPVLLDS
jgi:hypothetical protein